MQNLAIVSINAPSFKASQRLREKLSHYNVTLYGKDEGCDVCFLKLDDVLEELWQKDGVIFLLATGIVVRKIAPFLKSKASDPAILVASIDLKKVLPLLSGHLGGANELSQEICTKIEGAVSFTTTATDQTKTLAFDMFAKKQGFVIQNLSSLAAVSNALINKEAVEVVSYEALFDLLKQEEGFDEALITFCKPKDVFASTAKHQVFITPQSFATKALLLKPVRLSIGLGMNRGTPLREVEEAVMLFCLEHNIDFNNIQNVASFSAKSDEKGLLEFCDKYGLYLQFFEENAINALEKEFSSSAATKFFNIKGVAEPSAILASAHKELILKKRVYGQVTIALAI